MAKNEKIHGKGKKIQKTIKKAQIVNQKSMEIWDDPQKPLIIVYPDLTDVKAKVWNLYGKEMIQAMMEVCKDALE